MNIDHEKKEHELRIDLRGVGAGVSQLEEDLEQTLAERSVRWK